MAVKYKKQEEKTTYVKCTKKRKTPCDERVPHRAFYVNCLPTREQRKIKSGSSQVKIFTNKHIILSFRAIEQEL